MSAHRVQLPIRGEEDMISKEEEVTSDLKEKFDTRIFASQYYLFMCLQCLHICYVVIAVVVVFFMELFAYL